MLDRRRYVGWAAIPAVLLLGCGDGKPAAPAPTTIGTKGAVPPAVEGAPMTIPGAGGKTETPPTTPPATTAVPPVPATTASAPAPDGAAGAAAGDLPYLTADVIGLLHVRVSAIRQVPLVKQGIEGLAPIFAEATDRDKETVARIGKVDEAWIYVDPTPIGPAPVSAYGVIRFLEPLSVETLAKEWLEVPGELVEAEIEGQKFRTCPELEKVFGVAPSLMQVDPKTILVAPETVMLKILSGKPSPGPLAEILAKHPTTGQVRFVGLVGPLKPKLEEAAEMLGKQMLQSPFDGLPKLLPHLEEVGIALDLEGKTLLEVSFGLDDEANAAGAHELLTQAWTEAKPLLGMAKQQAAAEVPAVAGLLEDVRKGVSVAKQELRVSVSLPRPADLEKAIETTVKDAIPKVRAQALKVQRMNNLKQVALGMLNYEATHNKLPNDIRSKDGKPLLSWRVHLLPYLDQQALYEKFKLDEPWDSEHNKPLSEIAIPVFETTGAKPGTTSVFVFKGAGTPFPTEDKKVGVANIRDGMSNTLFAVVAKADKAVPWTQPSDLDFDPEKIAELLEALPEKDILAARMDGSVWVWKARPKAEILKALITLSGMEVVNIDDLE